MPGLDQRHLDVRVRHLLAQAFAHGRDRVLGGRVERAGQGAAAGHRARDEEVAARPARGSGGSAARIDSAAPSTLVSIIAFQCSTLSSRKPRLAPKPALAKTTSRRAEARRAPPRTSACWSSQLGHVAAARRSRPRRRRAPPASSRSLSSERAPSTTRQPNSTARRAVAAPMPRAGAGDHHDGHRPSRWLYHLGFRGPWPTTTALASRPSREAAATTRATTCKACHPSEPLGVWIRYTVHKRPGAEPKGSLWFTLFDASAEAPQATKLTVLRGRHAGGDAVGRDRRAPPSGRARVGGGGERGLGGSSTSRTREPAAAATSRARGCTAPSCRARRRSARTRRRSSAAA